MKRFLLKSQIAFTFVELLIVLCITTILLAISIPSIFDLLAQNTNDVLQKQLLHAIQIAHQEARFSNASIILCKSQNQKNCGGSWSHGFLVFKDVYQDGTVHKMNQILFVMQLKSYSGELYWVGYPFYHDYLQFLPHGKIQNDNGTFWFCAARHEKPVWAIRLNQFGATEVYYPDKEGLIKDSRGRILQCRMLA